MSGPERRDEPAHSAHHETQEEGHDSDEQAHSLRLRVARRRRAAQHKAGGSSSSEHGEDEPQSLGESRAKFIEDAKNRVDKAYTAFVSACHHTGTALKEAAAENREMFSLFAEVALGFMMPGLTRGLGAVLDKLPAGAPEFAYKIALTLQKHEVAETALEAATKVGLKKASEHFFPSETSEDVFLRNLEVSYQAAFQSVGEGLDGRSEKEILATWAAFDARLTNVNTYIVVVRNLVDRFKRQVGAIGRSAAWGPYLESAPRTAIPHQVRGELSTRAVRLWEGTRFRPALLYIDDTADSSEHRFVRWISDEMVDMAENKTRSMFGKIEYVVPAVFPGDGHRFITNLPFFPLPFKDSYGGPH